VCVCVCVCVRARARVCVCVCAEIVSTVAGSTNDGWVDAIGLSASFSGLTSLTPTASGKFLIAGESSGRIRLVQLSNCMHPHLCVVCVVCRRPCVLVVRLVCARVCVFVRVMECCGVCVCVCVRAQLVCPRLLVGARSPL
jgi:hypothetical protein